MAGSSASSAAAGRLSEAVVGLAHPLPGEVTDSRRQPPDVHLLGGPDPGAAGLQGTDQLQVLEQDVAVVAAVPQERGATDGHGAGVVRAEGAVDQAPGTVPRRVPGQRAEIVLRDHEVRVSQQGEDEREGLVIVADVVVGDDHLIAVGDAHAGDDAVDLAVAAGQARGSGRTWQANAAQAR